MDVFCFGKEKNTVFFIILWQVKYQQFRGILTLNSLLLRKSVKI